MISPRCSWANFQPGAMWLIRWRCDGVSSGLGVSDIGDSIAGSGGGSGGDYAEPSPHVPGFRIGRKRICELQTGGSPSKLAA